MKLTLEEFHRWFNRSFWKGFKNQTLPISIPKTSSEKKNLVEKVYSRILSAHYAPSIPEAEIIVNKGFGVARTVPVFCMEDYCVYYFCIKKLEEPLGSDHDN